MITFPEIVEIDLPTIIILIVLWLLNHFKLSDIEKKLGSRP